MGYSSYPNGWANGVIINGMPLLTLYPGKQFWVNNSGVIPKGGIGGSDTNDGTYLRPFSTIDATIGKCLENRGDIICVMPGHAENVASAGAIACDVAGVAIIGLGQGTLRPTISFTTATAAAITVSAANVTLHNMIFNANFADVAAAIVPTAVSCTVSYCHFKQAGADLNFVDYITPSGAANTADGLTVDNCTGYGIDAAINSPLSITDDLLDLVFTKNRFNTDNANALAMITCATGKDLNNCFIAHNYYASKLTAVDVLVNNDTTDNDGWAAHNRAQHLDTGSEVLVDADGVGQFDNLGTGSVTASGYVLPAIDS